MYGEDADLCARLRDAGWGVELCPDARFVHVGGGSTGSESERMRIELLRSWLRLIAKLKGIREAERARRWTLRAVRARALASPRPAAGGELVGLRQCPRAARPAGVSAISPLELLHPAGRVDRVLVLGDGCPGLMPPAAHEAAAGVDLALIAPSGDQVGERGWLERAADAAAPGSPRTGSPTRCSARGTQEAAPPAARSRPRARGPDRAAPGRRRAALPRAAAGRAVAHALTQQIGAPASGAARRARGRCRAGRLLAECTAERRHRGAPRRRPSRSPDGWRGWRGDARPAGAVVATSWRGPAGARGAVLLRAERARGRGAWRRSAPDARGRRARSSSWATARARRARASRGCSPAGGWAIVRSWWRPW